MLARCLLFFVVSEEGLIGDKLGGGMSRWAVMYAWRFLVFATCTER